MQTAVRKSAFGGGKLAEAEVARRANAGQGRRQILAETGIAASVADKVLADASDREFRSRMRSQRDASAALQRSILAAALDDADRAEAIRTGEIGRAHV